MSKGTYRKIISFFMVITLIGIIFMACTPENDIEGKTYKGTAKGYRKNITVHVTVGVDGKINALKVNAKGETPDLGGKAASKVAKQIVAQQNLAVDTITGATITSNAVITATENALKEAGIDTEPLKIK